MKKMKIEWQGRRCMKSQLCSPSAVIDASGRVDKFLENGDGVEPDHLCPTRIADEVFQGKRYQPHRVSGQARYIRNCHMCG